MYSDVFCRPFISVMRDGNWTRGGGGGGENVSLSFEGCFFVRDDVVGKSTSESSFFLSFFLCEKPSPPGLGLGDERSIAAPAMFGRMMMSFS